MVDYIYQRNTTFKRFCAINHPTTSKYKNNIKINLQDNFIIYLAIPKSIVQCNCPGVIVLLNVYR